jgi:hypothetical protein
MTTLGITANNVTSGLVHHGPPSSKRPAGLIAGRAHAVRPEGAKKILTRTGTHLRAAEVFIYAGICGCRASDRMAMTKFVLWVFLTTQGVTGGIHQQKVDTFDSMQSCVSAARAIYPNERTRWECLPER